MSSETSIPGINVTIVMIPYNNEDRFKTRLERDIIPTILAHPSWNFQIVIIDNSDEYNMRSCNILNAYNIDHVYKYPGYNLMYGPSMNLAVEASKHPYLVYVCSNHGHMYDPTWIDDLVHPIINDPLIAMTGSHYPSCYPGLLGFPSHLPAMHIQGGVFGARTEYLLNYPYTKNEHFVHWGSDVYECFQLLNAGFSLHDVTSVKSVWRQSVSDPERWKYVHDDSE
jgi:hypothetical protein